MVNLTKMSLAIVEVGWLQTAFFSVIRLPTPRGTRVAV